MAKIKQIVERRWTYPGERETSWSYRVYYASGKLVQYSHNNTLPISVTRFLCSEDGSAETTYREGCFAGKSYTVKETIYRCSETEEAKPKPERKRQQTARPYAVTFVTQRNRVEYHREYLAKATSKTQAIEQARISWYQTRDEHMFHCEAKRLDEIPEGREPYTFAVIDTRAVTWGYRR